jgi:Pyruvate/2-oxoacid:ferredoxin oxidoreductase delta subunit
MGHLTTKNYIKLQKRMDRFVPGIYDSKNLYEILKILFTDEEAKLCSVMPLNYVSVKKMAEIWNKTEKEAEAVLDNLARKGLVYARRDKKNKIFTLALPVLGFFEFSLMRLDGEFDRKKLSELYYKYINIEDGFIKRLSSVDPPISRVFVHEDTIEDITSEVLSHEKVSKGIDNAYYITVGTCFCRHKMEHLGKTCDNPQDVCLTFNGMAEQLSEYGIARKISKDEAHKIIDLCVKRGLVQIGDNTKDELVIICNCCSCCCDLLLGYKRLGPNNSAITPSGFIADIDCDKCAQCGECFEKCPVDAILKINDNFVVDKKRCLGCGVCSNFCQSGSCEMKSRAEKVFVPENTSEKIALQAMRQGKLGNFIFDNQRSVSHKILRTLLNFFSNLPPIKQLLQNQQFSLWLTRKLLKSEIYSSINILCSGL